RLHEALGEVGRQLHARPWQREQRARHDLASDMHRADRVQVAVVHGPWEDKLGESELLHTAQPLELHRVNDRELAAADSDGPMDRITQLDDITGGLNHWSSFALKTYSQIRSPGRASPECGARSLATHRPRPRALPR